MLVALRQLPCSGSWHNNCFLSQTCIASCRCISWLRKIFCLFFIAQWIIFSTFAKEQVIKQNCFGTKKIKQDKAEDRHNLIVERKLIKR